MTQTAIRAEEVTWTDPTCPVARTLDLIGDRWSLLIVRDAMDGARAFTDFQQRTGIARNILTDRLRRLVERGILDRQAAPSGRRQLYTLTPAGRDLFTVIVALRQWGERHALPRTRPTPSSSMNTVSRCRSSGRSTRTATPLTSARPLCGRTADGAADLGAEDVGTPAPRSPEGVPANRRDTSQDIRGPEGPETAGTLARGA